LAANDYIFVDPIKAFKYSFENENFSFPGGETSREVKERGHAALNERLHNYNGKRIAIGIHGNIMTNIMNYFDDRLILTFGKLQQNLTLYGIEILRDNTNCYSKIIIVPRTLKIMAEGEEYEKNSYL